jgi:ferredoxin
MTINIYYYTGTGNSLWTARTLGKELGGTTILPISRITAEPVRSRAEMIGLIFPVHIWGLPRRVIAFINMLERDPSKYYFAIAVNAGQVAETLLQMKKVMCNAGLLLSAGFGIVMPSNYIPWGGPGPVDKRMQKIRAAEAKIKTISPVIAGKESRPVEKGPLWQNVLFSFFYRMSFPHVPSMDKSFWVNDKCNRCGVCISVCPCSNITMQEDKPVWLHHCEQCLACIQWCPKEAIQFGKRTARYERYHHPEIKLRDITISNIPE